MRAGSRGMTLGRHRPALGDPVPEPPQRRGGARLPGTCLLEATNATEGRGTEAPFLLVGAPWMKAEAVAREAATPGFALEPTTFTPEASAAAPTAEAPRGSLPGASRAGDGCRRRAALGPRAPAADRPAPAPGVRSGCARAPGSTRSPERRPCARRSSAATAWRRSSPPKSRPSSAGAASGRLAALLMPDPREARVDWSVARPREPSHLTRCLRHREGPDEGPDEGRFYRRGSGHTRLASRPKPSVDERADQRVPRPGELRAEGHRRDGGQAEQQAGERRPRARPVA